MSPEDPGGPTLRGARPLSPGSSDGGSRACAWCGDAFAAVRASKRYCSERCRTAAANDRRRAGARERAEAKLKAGPVRTALEESVKAGSHLSSRDAAAIAAARALADKIDAWDVIVQWAIEDAAAQLGSRPKVPQNDNVSLPSFLKYLEALQLVPPAPEKAKPGPPSQASPAQQALNEMRKGLSVVPEVG